MMMDDETYAFAKRLEKAVAEGKSLTLFGTEYVPVDSLVEAELDEMEWLPELSVILDEGAYMPERAHRTDAGADLKTPHPVTVLAHDSAVIDTGVHVQIPEGFVGKIEAKSGLNFKHDLTCTGTIDSGYTGTIRIKLFNHGPDAKTFKPGNKVAQLVIYPIPTPKFVQVSEFEDTERGDAGFGSTGD